MPFFPPEAPARTQIDQQLAAAGWAVQDVKEINLQIQLGVSVRVPRDSSRHSTKETFPTATGPADYMLFADGKAIGIIEAKKVGETLSAVHTQAALALAKDQRQLVVLDDVLNATDSGRHARILNLLKESFDHLQIIILTCHPERYRALDTAEFFELTY